MKIFKIFLLIVILISLIYLLIFPIRYLVIDFGLKNLRHSFIALIQITFTNKQFILIEEKQIEDKQFFTYIIKPNDYIKTIETVMRKHNFVPNNIGMLGERIPYNKIDSNEKINVLHGFSKFYCILKFERDI